MRADNSAGRARAGKDGVDYVDGWQSQTVENSVVAVYCSQRNVPSGSRISVSLIAGRGVAEGPHCAVVGRS